jgi:hypothetical protein
VTTAILEDHSATAAADIPDVQSPCTSVVGSASKTSSSSADNAVDSNNTDDYIDIDRGSIDFPLGWDEKQFRAKCEQYSWLCGKNGKLGCLVCRDVKTLKLHQSQGLKLSAEWVHVTIDSFGSTLSEQKQSLRKKMFDHKNSKAHLLAEMITEISTKNVLPESNANHYKNEYETTCRVFRTAYKICKKERPFSDLPTDIKLQQLNGANMGRVLHTDHSCADIVAHIANEMRQKLVADIIANEHKISVLVDESTSVSGLTILTVCMRAAVTGSGPLTFFLDMVELTVANAETIKSVLLTCLALHGFNDAYLKKHFICFAADGASTMLGNKAGVATLLLTDFPDLVVWHCCNHRLELAVGDTIKEVAGINNFQSFIDKLYTTYHASPKNKRELKLCAAAVESQLLVIGRIFDVRWVSSSERTIKAVWASYAALYEHFLAASTDSERDTTTRQKYIGLSKRLTAVGFVNNVGMLLDALTELGDLSRELQKRDMTLARAQKLIDRQIRVLESMAETAGPYLKQAKAAIAERRFKGISLGANTKVDIEISQGQFFRSLVANLRSRMETTSASNVGINEKARASNINKYNNLLASIEVLNKDNWKDKAHDELYGESEMQLLCDRMGFNDENARKCILGFREFRDPSKPMSTVPQSLQHLFNAVDTYVISTAECERSFSVMNDILTPTRNSLKIDHLSQLVFVKCVGPPLSQFKPRDYVTSWIRKGRRSADETHCPARSKKEQSHSYNELWKLL